MAEPDVEEIFSQFSDLFGDLFGGERTPLGAPLTRDVRQTLEVTAAEAADGGQRELEVTRIVACEACHGRGAPAGAEVRVCLDCRGRGGASHSQGVFQLQTTCQTCGGAGGELVPACEECEGSRGERLRKDVTVTIPGGVASGQTLRLQGQGNDLHDGAGPGALMLTLVVSNDDGMKREGADLLVSAEVPPDVARRGGKITVQRFGAPLEVTVPKGAGSGTRVRVRGFGALKLGAPSVPLPTGTEPYRSVDPGQHRGDLVVTLMRQGDPLAAPAIVAEEEPIVDPKQIAIVVGLSAGLIVVLWLLASLL